MNVGLMSDPQLRQRLKDLERETAIVQMAIVARQTTDYKEKNGCKTTEPSTEALVREWRGALKVVDNARSRLKEAEDAVQTAGQALAQRIAPKDIRDGEVIGLWVRIDDHDEILVTIRKTSIHGLTLETRR